MSFSRPDFQMFFFCLWLIFSFSLKVSFNGWTFFFLILMKSDLSVSPFLNCAFEVISKKSLPKPILSSEALQFYVLHLVWIKVLCLSLHGYTIVPESFVGKIYCFSAIFFIMWAIILLIVKKKSVVCICVSYFWFLFYSIDLFVIPDANNIVSITAVLY